MPSRSRCGSTLENSSPGSPRDRTFRIVILTGAGGNFSAGADIAEFPRMRADPDATRRYNQAGHDATIAIRDLPQPTIAAAHGFCVGGGCGIALACDLRVGDATTQMGIPAARRGIVYTVLDTELLMRTVGLPSAKMILYSGNIFPMERCREMRLLDDVEEMGASGWCHRACARLGVACPAVSARLQDHAGSYRARPNRDA